MARAGASVGFSLWVLAGALAAAVAQEDKMCCFYGECGGPCKDGVRAEHWCGASEEHCGQCSGAWCLGGSGKMPPAAHYVPYSEEDPQTQLAGGAGGMCCFWSDNGDMCGNCQSASTGDEWCAANKEQCGACAGTWCTSQEPSDDGQVTVVLPTPPAPSPEPQKWIEGTWTTSSWDCCKPTCGWPNKGLVTQPVRSCRPDGTNANPEEESVCNGGTAGSCVDNQPWVVGPKLSMGFATLTTGGGHGLQGDANCGQCYELMFTNQSHLDGGEYGGANLDIAGKRHIVQVTGVGHQEYTRSVFVLQIPGASVGQHRDGCRAMFPSHASGDFDCENSYDGCYSKSECLRLPEALRPGCEWRFDFYKWVPFSGYAQKPYVLFRRVRCPAELLSITGAVPLDDEEYQRVA